MNLNDRISGNCPLTFVLLSLKFLFWVENGPFEVAQWASVPEAQRSKRAGGSERRTKQFLRVRSRICSIIINVSGGEGAE